MSHWVVAPIVLPLLTGAVLMLVGGRWPSAARVLAGFSLLGQLAAIGTLAQLVDDGTVSTYLLGSWEPPYGIALVADRLAVLMLAVTAVLGVASFLAALGDADLEGPHFHALLQFQLVGLNGAFLTGDLFNLFVFFEVLLAASYALLLHGRDAARLRPGLQYVVANLVASALFLVAAATLYGVAGSLNFADLALRLRDVQPADVPLIRTAALFLLVVFGVKSALLPLHLWLPQTYRTASVPIAALFVVMTKVGVYAIARVFTLLFEPAAPALAGLATPWLYAGGLATLAVGALGALGAGDLRALAAWLVVVSAGTLLATLASFDASAMGGALFYLAPSAVAGAALFVVAGIVIRERGAAADDFRATVDDPGTLGSSRPRTLTGALYALVALAIAGLPPFAGFLAKAAIVANTPARPVLWTVLLVGSLLVVIALARAGSALFWRTDAAAAPGPAPSSAAAAPSFATVLALAWLAACILALVPAAGALQRFTQDAALQLAKPDAYVEAVMKAR